MQNAFDWLRRCHSGAELLATLEFIRRADLTFPTQDQIGPPHSALDGPCPRCWIYPRQQSHAGQSYCSTCAWVLDRARHLGRTSMRAAVVWAKLIPLPTNLVAGEGFYADQALGFYVHDARHFLLVLPRQTIKDWLQELMLYHGADLRGAIQIFPTVGTNFAVGIGEMLCRIIHHEVRLSMRRLQIRFYASPYQVLKPHVRDRQGLLTFELDDFLSLLEMAAVFRTMLLPDEQELLEALLKLDDPQEEMFYWGRFLGRMTPAQRDMLQAWQIRNWSAEQVRLLYELVDYVDFY